MTRRFLPVPFFLLLGLTACDGSGSMGLETDEDPGQVVLVDTITVQTSTVYAGPVPTSYDSVHLVGNYTDEKLGSIRAISYFQVAPENPSFAKDREVLFDSLALIINCNGYYYGDTTRSQTLQVYELGEEIVADERSPSPEGVPVSYLIDGEPLFNTNRFDYDAGGPITTAVVRPRPSRDSLHIRLPDELGREWFHLSEEGDEVMSNRADFLDYFKGIVLATAPEDRGAVIGYHTGSTRVRLYYRERHADGVYHDVYTDFPLVNQQLKFNEIVGDRSGTPLAGLNEQNKETLSGNTNEETFLQAGTGLMTGITLPYIRNFIDVAQKDVDVSRGGTVSIHSAQLVVEPIRGTHNGQTYLPESLMLYTSGTHNIPLAPLEVTGSRDYDDEFPDQTRYKFNITEYFSELVKKPEHYQDVKLLLSLTATDLFTGTTRLCIGSQQHPRNRLRLLVYYTPN